MGVLKIEDDYEVEVEFIVDEAVVHIIKDETIQS